MARDIYIDTDSRQFVEGIKNSATKIQGPYFKGDTETLNLYFLQRTGIIGTPYAFTDKSTSTAKITLGTVGQSPVLSVTGFSTISQNIAVGVTISQEANKDSNTVWTNQIQKISFSKVPYDGTYQIITGTTGVTASYVKEGFFLTAENAFDPRGKMVFNSITGATCSYPVGTITDIDYQSVLNIPNTYSKAGFSIRPELKPYNAKVTYTENGTTTTKRVKFLTSDPDIKLCADEPTNAVPMFGTSVVFSSIVGVTGITTGTTYYVSKSSENYRAFSITASSSDIPKVLAIIKPAQSGIEYANIRLAVTGVKNNRLYFRDYDKINGRISNDLLYYFNDQNWQYGRFYFESIVDLTGVTASDEITYHFNAQRSGNTNGSFSIYLGDGFGSGDYSPQVTGISTSIGNVEDFTTGKISAFTASTPVYTFTTQSETSLPISYDEEISSIQEKLSSLGSIGRSSTAPYYQNISLTRGIDGNITAEFTNDRAYTKMPLMSVNSSLISPPGLTATVGITSAAITTLLSGTTSAPVTLEVELTTSGNKLTAAQGDVTLATALSH
jgi:hypothetical protein